MLIKTKAIVISALKYQEKSLIVKCYTQTDGLKTYFVNSVFSSKKNNQKIAYFQPLTILEIEANHKNKGSLEHFKEIKISYTYQSATTHLLKSSVMIFLAEVLANCINEGEKNEDLFSYLETALIWFDTHTETVNFHLILLLELTKFLGFYPDIFTINQPFFNKLKGTFCALEDKQTLDIKESELLKKLIELKFYSNQKVFTGKDRRVLLNNVLDFYQIQLDGFKKPKSLDVLKEIFA